MPSFSDLLRFEHWAQSIVMKSCNKVEEMSLSLGSPLHYLAEPADDTSTPWSLIRCCVLTGERSCEPCQ